MHRTLRLHCELCIAVRYKQLEERYTEAVLSITEQKQLIIQLEEDLRSVNAFSGMFRGDAEVRSVPRREQQTLGNEEQKCEMPS